MSYLLFIPMAHIIMQTVIATGVTAIYILAFGAGIDRFMQR
jgi:hypothetical protein